MNISHLLVNSARKYPDRIGIISGDKRFSYEALNNRVNRLAHAMRQAGIKKGDRVALIMFNDHRFIEIYFAAVKLGAVVVPINYRFLREEIKHIIDNSRACILFFDNNLRKTISSIHKKLKSIREFVSVDERGKGSWQDYETFLSLGNAEEPEIKVGEDDPCQIMYTSGTTGKPKGAVISHSNIFWNLINTIIGREHHPGEVSLIIGPLFHTAALNNHFTVQVALGGTSILIRNFDPETVLKYIQDEKANVISGAPTMFNMLLQYPGLSQFDTTSITKCTTGASMLPEEIKERLLKVFPNAGGIFDLYGCTEASPTITILSAKDSLRKKCSVGLPAPFVEVRVVDEKDRTLPPNQVGELICRGPNVIQGYFKENETTKETFKNGWFYTGDLGRVDEEGYFYIVDRKKDMIVSGGENIYPREVEEVLVKHPAIADVAVVGTPHPVWGETVKAFVVRKEGQMLDAEQVIEFCKERLASYKKPTIIEFINAIPVNTAGKPLKTALKKYGTDGESYQVQMPSERKEIQG